jgi:hypothetical protein
VLERVGVIIVDNEDLIALARKLKLRLEIVVISTPEAETMGEE